MQISDGNGSQRAISPWLNSSCLVEARLDISNALQAAAAGGAPEEEHERVKIIEFLLEKGMDINRLEFAGEEDFPR